MANAMNRHFARVFILSSLAVVIAAFFSIPAAASDDAVGPEEYEIINPALGGYDVFTAIDRTTVSEMKLDSALIRFLASSGIIIDDHLAEDFNNKNIGLHKIEDNRLPQRRLADEPQQGMPGGKEILRLSRPGFDKGKTSALIFIRYRSIGPKEAFYEEDNFILLRKKESGWAVVKKVMASQRYY